MCTWLKSRVPKKPRSARERKNMFGPQTQVSCLLCAVDEWARLVLESCGRWLTVRKLALGQTPCMKPQPPLQKLFLAKSKITRCSRNSCKERSAIRLRRPIGRACYLYWLGRRIPRFTPIEPPMFTGTVSPRFSFPLIYVLLACLLTLWALWMCTGQRRLIWNTRVVREIAECVGYYGRHFIGNRNNWLDIN